MTKSQKIETLLLLREKRIREAKTSFWSFCKLLHGYKVEWHHLETLCDTLQEFFENKLLKEDGTVYRKLMINMPPRHYKTRTLILFSAWAFGKENSTKIISCSYSEDLATDFSRYTRDEIKKEKNNDLDIAYSDIFPETTIKKDDGSYRKWALEGQYFNYKGAGFGSSITGKGCDIGIIDDQIKNYEEAFNDLYLEKTWNWYTGTFLSRLEEGAKQIIVMTRWANKDICGMIQSNEEESQDWYRLVLKAHDEEKDEMLCPEMLSKGSYEEKRRNIQEDVFLANYQQEPLDKKGALYQELKTYKELPKDDKGNLLCHSRIAYFDTADQGDDYLCAMFGIEYNNIFYMTDVYYTKEPQEITEKESARILVDNDIRDCTIESNNGGRGFSRNVKRILETELKVFNCTIRWFHQGNNKISRIMTNASNVENRILFPVGWNYIYPEFYKAMTGYKRAKKNKHDDAPDCATGVVEKMDKKHKLIGLSAGDLGL